MKHLILKIQNNSIQTHSGLNKIVGLIDPKSVFHLIDKADLEANPRLAKTNKVTDAILESLDKTPDLFMFKSKGLLVSARECMELERSRYKINFEDQEIEGILDGGHNTLALGIHLLNKAIPENKFKIKTWSDLSSYWTEYSELVEEYILTMPSNEEFLVPFELIFPNENSIDQYIDNILDISASRNNNSELTDSAKANHAGYYKELQTRMDKAVADKVEWKANEPNKSIKSQDIVSLALIPLLALEAEGKLKVTQKINKVSLYSSKGQCVKLFNHIVEAHSSRDQNGDLIIDDQYILSAFELMKDIPALYDLIYEAFPEAYNQASSRFGGMNTVVKYEGNGRQPTTKFYNKKVSYKYPDGFIYPAVVALSKLITVKDNKVSWKVEDPVLFIKQNLAKITSLLIGHIKTHQYNPQSVGKDSQSYNLTEVMTGVVLTEKGLN